MKLPSLLVLLLGFAAGAYALVRESDKDVSRLRPRSWIRVALVVVITLVLSIGGDGADVWLVGVAAGILTRVLGHDGRLDRWSTLPGVRPLTLRTSGDPNSTSAAEKSVAGLSAERAPRPAPPSTPLPEVGDGGAPARRAVTRWAWRLLRREWRQQLLILSLISAAVAATILGAGIATNTQPPANGGFGTANHLASLPGSDPHLAADLAQLQVHFGTTDVIENQNIATGFAQGAQLRAQDPNGPYGQSMLALVSGRYPTGSGEAAMTSGLASTFGLHVDDVWHENGRSLLIVGLVENPQNLLDDFALVAPGQLSAPTQATVLFDATPAAAAAYQFPLGAAAIAPQGPSGPDPALFVFAVAVLGLIFVGLVAAAGFAVLAQRRLRALGLLSSLGASDRNVRQVMVANGAAVGVIGALAGGVIGFAAWVAYLPRFSASVDHRVFWNHLPWWLIAAALVLAVVTATLAARPPARAVARIPVVVALSGRPVPPRPLYRSAGPALVLLVTGPVLLAFSGGWGANGGKDVLYQLGGLLASALGLLLLAPLAIAALAVRATRAPISIRIALRDLARYRARSAAALAAGSFAVLIAMLVTLLATGRYADAVDYVGPNVASNQLVLYTPDNQHGNGTGGPVPLDAQHSLATLQVHANAVASALGSHNVLELDAVSVQIMQALPLERRTGNSTNVYVATPALLSHYGINPSQIDPDTLLVTSRPGLQSAPDIHVVYGNFTDPNSTSQDIASPKIQTFDALPTATSLPNLLVTAYAVQKLDLKPIPAGWVIQAPGPLTQSQINTARQQAAAAGMTIEIQNDEPSLAELRNDSTAAGILLALGVLAMTVGLIRAETANDLRTLTATGARLRTRRAITGATAGVLGLLGALLGTAVAYLDTATFFGIQAAQRLSHVPVFDLLLVLVVLPAVATIGGWLLAARQPPAIARQPLG